MSGKIAFKKALTLSITWLACYGIVAGPIKPAIPYAATPLPLADVRLTGGPLKQAQDLDAAYLLRLDPDRMLFYFFKRAGLKPKADKGYGGWDEGNTPPDAFTLTGHIAGHYLSAVSLMWAATGDKRFKDRADYIVNQLNEVQAACPDGYLGALQNGHERFAEVAHGNIRSGGFNLNGLSSPWYVEHKIFAGLRDAYRYTGNPLALQEEIKFAGWVFSVVGPLTDAQDQKMLDTEFGGMNEVLADLYADTGDAKWLALSDKFEHHAVVDPLSRQQDILGGKHENTQVPKIIGEEKRYIYSGNAVDGAAADYFWDQVVYHHSFATGGQGHDEYFWAPDQLNNIVDGRDAESCPVYNMLKLTRTLFAVKPNAKYAAFEERALFNHVLASIDPNDGRTCYMVPVGHETQHEYQDMDRDFTCCVGSGMEEHALLGDGIYYASPHKLWINLYAPSHAKWEKEKVQLDMQTTFPEGDAATLKFSFHFHKHFTVALCRPAWAGEGFQVSVNGKLLADLPPPDSYLDIDRTWKNGDTVQLTLPKQLHLEPLPDNPRRVALLWGPLVLAGDLGPERGDDGEHAQGAAQSRVVPIFVAADQPVTNWLKRATGDAISFRTDGVGQPNDIVFKPFYQLPERTYGIYWDLFTPDEWTRKSAEIAAEKEHQRKLELATVAFIQPGEMQMERDYNEQGENSEPDRVMGRPARRGSKWFSFDVPVESSHPMSLVVTYYSDEWRKRTFDILVAGQKIGEQVVEKGGAPHFFDVEYPIPADLIAGKQKATVRFQATNRSEIAAIFGIRVIRTDAAR